MNKSQDSIFEENEKRFDDELSLLDLVAFVRRNFYTLLIGLLLGGGLGLLLAFSIPAQWEATAILNVGQLGSTGSNIEPTMQVVDRIKNKSFQNDVLKNLGISTIGDNEIAKDFRDTLKVKLEKSDLVNIAIRGYSSEVAKGYMNAISNQLINIHTKVSEPTIQRWQQELTSIQLELKQASIESERLVKSINSQTDSLSERSFSQMALMSNILLAREAELKYLRERKNILEDQLSPARTFNSKLIGRVEVSEKPVYPKKTLFTTLGMFIGLLVALLWSVLQLMTKNKKAHLNF